MHRWIFAAAATAALLVSPTSWAQHRVPNGAKILLLAGGQRDHHAYRRQAYLLQKLLEDTKQFQVTICEDAAILATPALNKYEVVVATADRRDPEFRLTRAQQEGLLRFVRGGKGFFSLHAFCCADRDWLPEMRDLLGGVLAHFGKPDTKVRVGKYPIRITGGDHPITRGLTDFEHHDELYYQLQTSGQIHPLAVADYDGLGWPILWARDFGRGRSCVSIFGHCGMQVKAPDPLEHEPFQRLVLRGIAWAARRELK